MATPAIRAIRKGMPEISELCLVGRYAPLSVLEGNPWSDSVLLYKPRAKSNGALSRRQLVSELRRRRMDMILLFPNSLSSACIAYLSGARHRVGFSRDARRWLLTDPIDLSWNGLDLRRVSTIEYYLHIARHLGCAYDDRRMELIVTPQDREFGARAFEIFGFDSDRPTLVINTSSAANDSRMWPSHHAGYTARRIAETLGHQVVIHCGPADRNRAEEVARMANHPLVKSMGQLTELPLGLSKAIIERASLVISTDSGPRHIAAAMNKQVISLFGPTDPDLYRTYNQPETVLRAALGCSPCGKNNCPLKHSQCMHQLTPNLVFDAVVRLASNARESSMPEEYRFRLPGSAA